MPDFNINIPALTQRIFGINGYRIEEASYASIPEYKEVEVLPVEEAVAYSSLGTPIYDIVRFKGGVVPGTDQAYDGLDLVDFPLISLTRSKNIQKTIVAGRPGEVKELISLGDWQVAIRGVLVASGSALRPVKEMKALQALADLPLALQVESELLNRLGINSLVIETIDFQPLEGFLNVQPYVLGCSSDEPIEAQRIEAL